MNIVNAGYRVWILYRDYLSVLAESGYGRLAGLKAYVATHCILDNLRLSSYRARIKRIIHFSECNKFDKMEVNAFMKVRALQAKKAHYERIVAMKLDWQNSESDNINPWWILQVKRGHPIPIHLGYAQAEKDGSKKIL